MSVRVRQAAAAALTAACLSALATPALASDGGGSRGRGGTSTSAPASSTSGSSSTTRFERPETSNTRSIEARSGPSSTVDRGRRVESVIDDMITKLNRSTLDAATRDALIARLQAARAAAVAGQPLDNATMQTLVRDVGSALGLAKGSDDHGGPTTAGSRPQNDDGPRHDVTEADGRGKDGVVRQLDAMTAKVNASTLSDADKKALLDKIAAVKVKVDAGTPLGHEELGQLMGVIRAAVGGAGGHGDRPEAVHPEDAGKAPGQRAVAEIDRQIAKVQASDLPDDVKAQILTALNDAKTQIAAGAPDSGGDGGAEAAREAIEAHRQARFDALSARLNGAADKIDAKLTALSADPANAALVTDAQAKLAQARDMLATATTPDDLRAAWKLLREIRMAIRAVEQPAPTTTGVPTTETPTTETPTTETPTTDVPATEPPVTDEPTTATPAPTDPSANEPTTIGTAF